MPATGIGPIANGLRHLRLLPSLPWAPTLLLAMGLGAAWVHHRSKLPTAYTWWLSVQIMWDAVNDPIFPMAALITLTGALVTLDATDRKRYLTPTLGDVMLFAVLTVGVVLLNLFKSAPLAPLDLATVLPVFWIVAVAAHTQGLARSAIALLAGLALLVTVSYVYTIFKANLFADALPQDAWLVAQEILIFGAPIYLGIAQWAAHYPDLVQLCDRVYFLFFQHMALVALVLWVAHREDEQRRYVRCLAVCYLVGGASYYLMPALGPAYFDPAAFAYVTAHAPLSAWVQPSLLEATNAVHNGTLPEIRTYGFVAAVPSLHMAHEVIMTYYLRRSPYVFLLSILFALLSGLSVLVLGWHYLFDIVAGLMLAALAITIAEFPTGATADARQRIESAAGKPPLA